ncbi:hypothetical protein PRUB_a0668 [Pseudoalteromonas rubra]|uniref:Uncharacterized protein n=2 Tax=Pseudoalteromonas rubra TaxID=43658 RepID=A0A8T0C5Z2_9GAMM|nr:hypothetical protein PRUB_a0668 [Pseudoalteromonas rubra]
MLFSSQTIINTTPINVNEIPTTIVLEEPISAINQGAKIEVDITHIVGKYENVVAGLNNISEAYPKGCLKAELITNDGKVALLDETGGSVGQDKSYVTFHTFKPIPTGVEFSTIKVSSCNPISEVTLIWLNSSK